MLQCHNRLYAAKMFTLNNSESKYVVTGMDPQNFFEMVVRIVDKKTGISINLSLENMAQLVLDIKQILKLDAFSERVSGLFASGCTVEIVGDNLFKISQLFGLASQRFTIIHKASLIQFVQLEYIFLQMAEEYDRKANVYISYLRQCF